MSLTPTALKQAFYNVLKSSTAAASVSVRAALGDEANSVIDKKALPGALPTTPFVVLAWNMQPSGGVRNRGVKAYYPAWVVYDDAVKGYYRIEALDALIRAAYAEDVIPMCFVDFEPDRDLIDAKLNYMPARSLLFKVKMRG